MSIPKASTFKKVINRIVLVHGAFADGSAWEEVFRLLKHLGYDVTIVQHPCTSLEDDVAAVRRALDKQDGPAILVGHSWGGAIITEAGLSTKVAGLVYIAAFQPDAGESCLDQIISAPDLSNGAMLPPDASGSVYLDPAKYHAAFCADLPISKAAFMSASQIPLASAAFGTPLNHAAWKVKPCWAIVPTEDKSINPAIQREIYRRSGSRVKEIFGASHVAFISHPQEVVCVIRTASREAIQFYNFAKTWHFRRRIITACAIRFSHSRSLPGQE